jgi:hypothetical protein
LFRFFWLATKGYRLRPWASPYLRWRIETYWGIHAAEMDGRKFRDFVIAHRADLIRFIRWAGRMAG